MTMTSAEVVLRHAAGLHARPATLFVKAANRYQSAIAVRYGEKRANAKSIVAVLTLGVRQGATIVIEAEGPDEAAAVRELASLVEGNFEAA